MGSPPYRSAMQRSARRGHFVENGVRSRDLRGTVERSSNCAKLSTVGRWRVGSLDTHRMSQLSQLEEEKRPNFLPLLSTEMITYLILFLASLVFLYYSTRRTVVRPRQITLVGPAASGKTALFSRVNYRQFLPTYSSVRANITRSEQGWRIVDTPGHPTLRLLSLIPHIDETTIFVFLLPSTGIPSSIQHLILLLSIIPLLPKATRPRIILLISKSDTLPPTTNKDGGAALIERIRNSTEREIQKLNLSKGGRNIKSKLDGLDKIPLAPTAPSTFPTNLASLQLLVERTRDRVQSILNSSSTTKTTTKSKIPTDESEVLNPSNEALSIFKEGVPWSWSGYEKDFGVRVDWVLGNSKEDDGLVEFWKVVKA